MIQALATGSYPPIIKNSSGTVWRGRKSLRGGDVPQQWRVLSNNLATAGGAKGRHSESHGPCQPQVQVSDD